MRFRQQNFNPQVPCGTRQSGPRWPSLRCDFNPQVPCGTRPSPRSFLRSSMYFNPQVPCGTRQERLYDVGMPIGFQSTGPLRDPTINQIKDRFPVYLISIHRSLAGPDYSPTHSQLMCLGFQSTGPLRDPTNAKCSVRTYIPIFQSTGPLRDPTKSLRQIQNPMLISIHRSLAGPDRVESRRVRGKAKVFQSTGPLRDPTWTVGGTPIS